MQGNAKERGKGRTRGERGRGWENETKMPIGSESGDFRREEGRVYAGDGRVQTVMEELSEGGEEREVGG